MENVKIQQDGKWIHFSVNSTKVIGQTEKGADKIASAHWEQIPGTNLKVMLIVMVAKEKKQKVKDEDTEAAPPVKNKTVKAEPEVVAETREERKARREKEKARAARQAAKGNAKQPDEEVAVKQNAKNSRRPTKRPKKTSRAATADYSDSEF